MASVDDFWIVDFGQPFPGEPAAHRPALVLGPPDTFGADFPFVIVAPLTTTHRGLSLHIEVEATEETGLDSTSYVQCELIHSINRKRLVRHIGAIGSEAGYRVTSVIKILLGH